ncbi:hypothetical protein, partial [Vibrio cyclitrophicus]|uniref:hypothetical protein n=1 Tax=Vibrio cyclitrophicus TaxID=47951 RepID=UPI0035317E6D
SNDPFATSTEIKEAQQRYRHALQALIKLLDDAEFTDEDEEIIAAIAEEELMGIIHLTLDALNSATDPLEAHIKSIRLGERIENLSSIDQLLECGDQVGRKIKETIKHNLQVTP